MSSPSFYSSPLPKSVSRPDIRFPMLFSPLAASSPVSNRARPRAVVIELSPTTSDSSVSSADRTHRATRGVDESLSILCLDDTPEQEAISFSSEHTALEYVDSFAFLSPPFPRTILQKALDYYVPLFENCEEEFVVSTLRLSVFWTSSVRRLVGLESLQELTSPAFRSLLIDILEKCKDDASRFVFVVSRGARVSHVTREELHTFFCDAQETLPDTPFPHDFFAEIATERVLWNACRTWSGKLLVTDIRSSEKLMNSLLDYSTDPYLGNAAELILHELQHLGAGRTVSRLALERINFGAISKLVWSRIFSPNIVRPAAGAVSDDFLTLQQFLHFFFAHNGMDDEQSIEYWMRVLDLNGDGHLSFFEIESFHVCVSDYLLQYGASSLDFRDLICQYCDMTEPSNLYWTLSDLKKQPRMSSRIIAACVNARKFFSDECEERFDVDRVKDVAFGFARTTWERFIDESLPEDTSSVSNPSVEFVESRSDDPTAHETLQAAMKLGSISLKYIVIISMISPIFCVDIDYMVMASPVGNSENLHNCSYEEDLEMRACLLQYFKLYGVDYGVLPNSSVDPFVSIRFDATDMCNNYAILKGCHAHVFDKCVNFNTLQAILESVEDTKYYVSQLAFVHFYCQYSIQFVNYFDCKERIADDDLGELIYDECREHEIGSCESVAHTKKCERAVFRRTCGSRKSLEGYCRYSTILLEMTGWNICEDMPCKHSISDSLRSIERFVALIDNEKVHYRVLLCINTLKGNQGGIIGFKERGVAETELFPTKEDYDEAIVSSIARHVVRIREAVGRDALSRIITNVWQEASSRPELLGETVIPGFEPCCLSSSANDKSFNRIQEISRTLQRSNNSSSQTNPKWAPEYVEWPASSAESVESGMPSTSQLPQSSMGPVYEAPPTDLLTLVRLAFPDSHDVIIQHVTDLLHSKRPNSDLQGDLIDLLGFEHFDL
ncbi:unnamed protein product [Caenorhabditis auriculariae]|uniref:EF-hand domain-containing protein n=1 Tax=Caenorhabditis auriculariae TaxID=2777116 RepID=A0A8S1HJW5_9PELO|nr:unnamed protein product [Caenorhabditis auriculariae]